MNLAVLRLFIFICTVTLFQGCFSSESLCKAMPAPVLTTVAPDDFLFRYFGIPGALKNAPRDLQKLISSQVKDLLIVQTELKPIKTYTEKGMLCKPFFTPDDSHILVISYENYVFACSKLLELKIDDPAQPMLGPPLPFPYKICCLNSQGTKIIEKMGNFSMREIIIEKLTPLTLKEGRIFDLSDQLYGKGKTEDMHDAEGDNLLFTVDGGHTRSASINQFVSMCYTPDDEIVIATGFKQVIIISQDRTTIQLIEDPNDPFKRDTIVLRYVNDYHRDINKLTKHYIVSNRAAIDTTKRKVYFFPSHGLVSCDYVTGDFKTCIEEDPCTVLGLRSESPCGDMLVFIDEECHRITRLVFYHEPTNTVRSIPHTPKDVKGPISWVHTSPNKKILLIEAWRYAALYHASSLSCIAYMQTKDGRHCPSDLESTLSPSGKYLALVMRHREPKYQQLPDNEQKPLDPEEYHLRIYRADPEWENREELYHGKLVLEEALLIIFLRSIAQQKRSLESIAHEYGITRHALTSYLSAVFQRIKNDSLKSYIRTAIIGLPVLAQAK